MIFKIPAAWEFKKWSVALTETTNQSFSHTSDRSIRFNCIEYTVGLIVLRYAPVIREFFFFYNTIPFQQLQCVWCKPLNWVHQKHHILACLLVVRCCNSNLSPLLYHLLPYKLRQRPYGASLTCHLKHSTAEVFCSNARRVTFSTKLFAGRIPSTVSEAAPRMIQALSL